MIRKICVVITARPSYSRIKSVLGYLQDDPGVDLSIVLAASAISDKYGNVESVIRNDGFVIAAKVSNLLDGSDAGNMARTAGLGLLQFPGVLEQINPDLVVTIADRFETISTAIAASYMNIPLAHIQGGEITGNIDEKVRHAITKLADVHLPSNQKAADRLIRMGELPENIYMTGCPSIDLAREVMENEDAFKANLFDLYKGTGEEFDLTHGYGVFMHHPVTSEPELAQYHVTELLEVASSLDLRVLWFWPNPDAGSDGTSKGIRTFRETRKCSNIHFFKNMAPHHFLYLLKKAKFIAGNSSVGIRECSYLGTAAINIGSRQHGRDRGGNVIDVGYSGKEVKSAIDKVLTGDFLAIASEIYGDGFSGKTIAEVLKSAKLSTTKRLTY